MNENKFCVICQESIDNNCVDLPGCNHSFHSNCIVPWLQKNNECPVCRYEPESSVSSSEDDSENTEYIESVIRVLRRRNISTGFRILRSNNLSRPQRLIKKRYDKHIRDLKDAKRNITEINNNLRAFKTTEEYINIQNELQNIKIELRKANTVRNRCLRNIQTERARIEQIGRDATR